MQERGMFMTRPRRVKKGYPHGYAPSYLTIPNEKIKNREKGRGLGQGLDAYLAGLEGSVLHVDGARNIALDLEPVGLEGYALLVLLALGQFQFGYALRCCHCRNL